MAAAPHTDEPTRAAPTRYCILGTAGHIDHGKTALVRALTGTDTDRLPEERRRGMTIELGFAGMTIGDTEFGIVDVPGHERFVRTMVAGATGIGVALIVVAADDSVMPQTIEHVDILRLLGVRRAVVAVTKIDVVEPDMLDLVVDDVRALLDKTPLAAAAICPVSSLTGQGIDPLKQAIVTAAQDVTNAPLDRPFRMAIDRVFTVRGRGTIVTGSALRGAVAAGDTLEVLPGGGSCRVRDLQAHGVTRDVLRTGQRAALNISGMSKDALARGAELATPGYLKPSRLLDVRLHCLPSHPRPLKSARVVRLGIGTVEVPVRVVLLDTTALEPGASAYAQLRSGEPVTAAYGQRFILRNENATTTIGGGVVLRPVAKRRRAAPDAERHALAKLETGDAADRVEQVLRAAGLDRPDDLRICAEAGVELDDVPVVLQQLEADRRWTAIADTGVHAVPAVVDDIIQRVTRWLKRYHASHPDEPGRHQDAVFGRLERLTGRTVARPLFDRMIRDNTVKRLGRYICLPAFAPALSQADERLLAAIIGEIRDGHFTPPAVDALRAAAQVDRRRLDRLVKLAVALGELIRIDAKLYLHSETETSLRDTVAGLVRNGDGVTVAQVREAIGSSRKFVVPFLEHLDRAGFTKRVGDTRVLADGAREATP
ncbi:MAG: selenocysteine-specific translation elongation factor [Phycisphaerae bacterium]